MKFTPVVVAALLLLSPAAASAEWRLAADGSAIFPTDDDFADTGFGIDVRLGYDLPLPLYVLPEVMVGYVNFGTADARALAPDAELIRAMVGGRVGLPAAFLRPSAFVHVGYANYSTDIGEALDTADDTFAWDAGLALDLLLPGGIEVGAHGAYNSVSLDDEFELELPEGGRGDGGRPTDWWSAGVHLSIPL